MSCDLSTWDDVVVVRLSIATMAPRAYAWVCQTTGKRGLEALSYMAAELHAGLSLLPLSIPLLRLPVELALEWIRDQAIET